MSSGNLHLSDYSPYTTSFLKHLLPDLFNHENPNFYKSVLMTLSIPQLVQVCNYRSECTSLVFQNLVNLDLSGVMQAGCYYCQISSDEQQNPQLIVCNTQDRSMVILKENEQHQLVEWIVCDPNNQTILDLNPMGRRWEGSVIDNAPCGYGVEYDERDEIAREGFVFQGQLVCWGYENYPNSNTKKYCGQYFVGKRSGHGVMYDLYEEVDYDGQWQLDQPKAGSSVESSLPLLDIAISRAKLMDLSSISIDSFCLSSLYFNLSYLFVNIVTLDSLANFTLENLPVLEHVAITCTKKKEYQTFLSSPYQPPKYPFIFHPPEYCGTGRYMAIHFHEEERKKYLERSIQSKCCIRNCPVLSRIDFMGGAFRMYTDLSLTNLPSLQSIDMRGSNFNFANSFVLKDLPELKYVRILGSVFVDASEVVIENLPKLEIFYIPGVFSLRGGVSDNTNNDSLYSMFTNLRERSLIMRNLPSLWYFVSEDAFAYTTRAVFENIPKLNEDSIFTNYGVFESLMYLQATNAEGLLSVIGKLRTENYGRHPNVRGSFSDWETYISQDAISDSGSDSEMDSESDSDLY